MALRSFGPLSLALVNYHLERSGMPLHDAVGVSCKGVQLLKIKAPVPGIRASVIWLDVITARWWREKVVVYWYIQYTIAHCQCAK